MWRTYDCPVDGCGFDTYDVGALARHVRDEHPVAGADGGSTGA